MNIDRRHDLFPRVLHKITLGSTRQRSPLEPSAPQRISVEFIGGPADGLAGLVKSDLPMDEVVGIYTDHPTKRIVSHVAIYGLSREAEGLRYRFLQFAR